MSVGIYGGQYRAKGSLEVGVIIGYGSPDSGTLN